LLPEPPGISIQFVRLVVDEEDDVVLAAEEVVEVEGADDVVVLPVVLVVVEMVDELVVEDVSGGAGARVVVAVVAMAMVTAALPLTPCELVAVRVMTCWPAVRLSASKSEPVPMEPSRSEAHARAASGRSPSRGSRA